MGKNYYYTLSRLPVEYFLTKGSGESNYGKGEAGEAAAEAGSYDAALRKANIHNYNIIKYTSLVPQEATKISIKKGKKDLKWGSVLECIMAQKNGKNGDTITAALLITEIYTPSGKYLGSFACEYSGNDNKKIAKEVLIQDVTEMVERRGFGVPSKTMKNKIRNNGSEIIDKKIKIKTSKKYTYRPKHFLVESMKINKKFGTVLTTLCYTKFQMEEVK